MGLRGLFLGKLYTFRSLCWGLGDDKTVTKGGGWNRLRAVGCSGCSIRLPDGCHLLSSAAFEPLRFPAGTRGWGFFQNHPDRVPRVKRPERHDD